jgi:hypothetical protein
MYQTLTLPLYLMKNGMKFQFGNYTYTKLGEEKNRVLAILSRPIVGFQYTDELTLEKLFLPCIPDARYLLHQLGNLPEQITYVSSLSMEQYYQYYQYVSHSDTSWWLGNPPHNKTAYAVIPSFGVSQVAIHEERGIRPVLAFNPNFPCE